MRPKGPSRLSVVDFGLVAATAALEQAISLGVQQTIGRLLPQPLPVEVRYQAYRRMRETVLRTLQGLDAMSEIPFTIRGAVWTWPVILRSARMATTNLHEMQLAFAEVVCVGTAEVALSSVAMMETVLVITRGLTPRGGLLAQGPVLVRGPDYVEQRTAVLEAVRRFMEVSTDDLAVSRRLRAASPSGKATPGSEPRLTSG